MLTDDNRGEQSCNKFCALLAIRKDIFIEHANLYFNSLVNETIVLVTQFINISKCQLINLLYTLTLLLEIT